MAHAAQHACAAGSGGVALAVGPAGLVDEQPVDAAIALVAEDLLLGVGPLGRAGADAVAAQLGLAHAAARVDVARVAVVRAPVLERRPAERPAGQPAAALLGDARVAATDRVQAYLRVQPLGAPGVGPAERQPPAGEVQCVGAADALVRAGLPPARAACRPSARRRAGARCARRRAAARRCRAASACCRRSARTRSGRARPWARSRRRCRCSRRAAGARDPWRPRAARRRSPGPRRSRRGCTHRGLAPPRDSASTSRRGRRDRARDRRRRRSCDR